MARVYEIEPAFLRAIEIDGSGRKTVTTRRFVQELEKVNWIWSGRQANKWIEDNVSTFKDISTEEGENRTFLFYNQYARL